MAKKKMKAAIIIGIITALVIVSFLYDISAGLTHVGPHFFTAPQVFCHSDWAGIALPPFGIWMCGNDMNNALLRRHELVHWDQYKRFGTLGFYANYLYAWASGGFNYKNNWMEKEATQKSGR